MRIAVNVSLAIAMLGCWTSKPQGTMTPTQPVLITGTTTTYAPGGKQLASYASPRITLDGNGNVVLEERRSPAGALEVRRRFGPDQRIEDEERFTANGDVDYRISFRYDDAGRLAEESMTFGDGTPHDRWIYHRDAQGRLVKRELVAPDGRSQVTESYTYAPDGRSATAVRGRVGQWTYEYDTGGRVVRKQGGPASGDEMDQEWIEYRYDTRHRLVRETEYYPDGGAQRQIIVAYP